MEGAPPLLADVREPTRLPPRCVIFVRAYLMSMESEYLQNSFEIAFQKLSAKCKDEVM